MSDPVLSVYSDQRKGLFKFLSSLILLEWSHDFLLLINQFYFLIQELCGHWRLEDNSRISNAMWYLINFNLQNPFREVWIIWWRIILFAPDIQYFDTGKRIRDDSSPSNLSPTNSSHTNSSPCTFVHIQIRPHVQNSSHTSYCLPL